MIAPLLLAWLLSFAAQSAPAVTAPPVTANAGTAVEQIRESIEELVQRAMDTPGAVALSVAVARGDEFVLEHTYGSADLEFEVDANEKTFFRIGSVTKQFTAAAILLLAERGKLSIDDPLTKFLPDYPTHGAEITLRNLLTHTSGVPNYTDFGPVWQEVMARELTDDELVALWKDHPLDFAPGERWKYSNSGYYLLGMVIAKVSGKSYAAFLEEAFWKPLGLQRTRYDSNAEVIQNRAQGYAFPDNRHENAGPLGMSQPGAAGGLISTAGDLVRWQQALVGGRVVKPASYEEMTLPFVLLDGRETNYGMGLQLEKRYGKTCVWHGGGINGFNSVLIYFPETRLHVAVISNSEGLNCGGLGFAISERLLAMR